MADERPVLELRGITKQFPGVLANDHVDFDLRRGEVHALLGENGAGKSTLMNFLYGLYQPDEGEILVKGEPVRFHSPKDAINRGIGMVHQHFMLIPVMTVAENIVLRQRADSRRAAARHQAPPIVGSVSSPGPSTSRSIPRPASRRSRLASSSASRS
jgi:simple sugar transport system ATP-binding protein